MRKNVRRARQLKLSVIASVVGDIPLRFQLLVVLREDGRQDGMPNPLSILEEVCTLGQLPKPSHQYSEVHAVHP